MSRIDDKFNNLKAKNQGALICFITAGDPNPDATTRITLELDRAGADIVEIGIPFSDPIADGPSIQASSMRALRQGVNVPKVLDIVRDIRKASDIPIVLMTYYNPILRYGVERFAYDASNAGADGVIITDLTPEESSLWKKKADENNINTIYLLAPTSTEERIDMVADLATGFIYCVSRTGVTGVQSDMDYGAKSIVERIRLKTSKPVAVGFGISTPEHVRNVCEFADGAIVGSILVNSIASAENEEKIMRDIQSLISALKSGTIRSDRD